MSDAWQVHNHGPSERRGTFCGERKLPDGRLAGWCLGDIADLSPAPTPTDEQQDARHTDDFDACPICSPPVRETVGMVCQGCGTDYAEDDARTIAWNTWVDDVGRHTGSRTRDLMQAFDAGWAARAVRPRPIAAVSAAAPDERDLARLAEIARLDRECNRLALELDAALAARPAPVVSGADVDRAEDKHRAVPGSEYRQNGPWCVCGRLWVAGRCTSTRAANGDPVRDVAKVLARRWNMSPRNKDVLEDARATLAALGIPVADAPAADDEGARA